MVTYSQICGGCLRFVFHTEKQKWERKRKKKSSLTLVRHSRPLVLVFC